MFRNCAMKMFLLSRTKLNFPLSEIIYVFDDDATNYPYTRNFQHLIYYMCIRGIHTCTRRAENVLLEEPGYMRFSPFLLFSFPARFHLRVNKTVCASCWKIRRSSRHTGKDSIKAKWNFNIEVFAGGARARARIF